MDIFFTSEQEAYRERFRLWLSGALPGDVESRRLSGPLDEDAEVAYQADWERTLYRAGYSGITWPTAYGGQGLSIIEHFLVMEELGRCAAPEGINSIGRELAGPIILAVGTEEQKREYLPRILSLDDIWCQGFSEPNAGSDLAAVATRAKQDGDTWVIDGQKIWTSYALHAQKCLLLVRTNPDAPKHKGLTLFLLEMPAPGIDVRPLGQITGRAEFNEVFLDGVRIPDRMRLGPVDGGWQIATGVLSFERGTNRLYRQMRFLNEFRAIVSASRRQPGYPSMRREYGKFYGELHQLRCRYLKAVSQAAEEGRFGPEASYIKLQWSELHQRLTRFAGDCLGSDFAWQTSATDRFQFLYLNSRADTILAGTSEIQRNIIADRILELPR